MASKMIGTTTIGRKLPIRSPGLSSGNISANNNVIVRPTGVSQGQVIKPTNQTATVSKNKSPGSGGIVLGYTGKKTESTPTKTTNLNKNISSVLTDAESAMNEAKQKTEASKESALGYYKGIDKKLDKMGDLITPEEKQRLQNQRKDTLANASQNLTEAFGDANSGIQTGRRLDIAQDTANQSANIPLETELDINQANRAANLNVISQKMGSAGAKTGIQMGYNYDPGIEYLVQLSEALGEGENSGLASLLSSLNVGSYNGSNITPNNNDSYISASYPNNPTHYRARIAQLNAYLAANPNTPYKSNYLAEIAKLRSLIDSNYYY